MGFEPRSTERYVSVTFILIQFLMFMYANIFGVELLTKTTSSCPGFRFLGITLVVFGCVFLLMFCFSCATFDKVPEVSLAKDIFCYVPIYFAMAGLAIFTLAVSSNGRGDSLPGRSYKEYNLSSYSKWMQNKVNDTHNWDKYYKTALIKDDVCSKFYKDYALETRDEFYSRDLSPLESGCCMPPDECHFNYTSPSNWMKSENQSYANMDCYGWDNDPNIRCFNCQSCKASFAQDLTSQWFWNGIYLVISLVIQLLLLMCSMWPTNSSRAYGSLLQ